jgi:hypothetical protein
MATWKQRQVAVAKSAISLHDKGLSVRMVQSVHALLRNALGNDA